MAKGMTQTEAAKWLGITQGAISRRVGRGQLKTLPDGTLSAEAVEDLRRQIDPDRVKAAKESARTKAPSAPEPEPTQESTAAEAPAPKPRTRARRDAAAAIGAERAGLTPHERKALADAESTEMKLAKLRGMYVEVADVAATMRQFARRVHDAVLAIPDDVHRALDGQHRCTCGEPIDVRPLTLELERHLREVLDVLSQAPLGGE